MLEQKEPPKELLVKKHMMLDKNDLNRVKEIWGTTIGVSKAVRLAIRRLLADYDAKTRK